MIKVNLVTSIYDGIRVAALGSLYQQRQNLVDKITYYDSFLYTHVSLMDGTRVLLSDWLPTVRAAKDAIDEHIASLGG